MKTAGEWQLPVVFEIGARGNYISISSAMEALACLDADWPEDDTDIVLYALEICRLAVRDPTLIEKSREAFITAVKEAKLQIRPHFSGH